MTVLEAVKMLKPLEQLEVILVVNGNKPFESASLAHVEAGRIFYDDLMRTKAEKPGVVFDIPNLEDNYEAMERLRVDIFNS